MSLILDALRKSEAERRRGQAPDLLSVTTGAAPIRPAPVLRYWLWALIAAAGIVLALSWAGWIRDDRQQVQTAPSPTAIGDESLVRGTNPEFRSTNDPDHESRTTDTGTSVDAGIARTMTSPASAPRTATASVPASPPAAVPAFAPSVRASTDAAPAPSAVQSTPPSAQPLAMPQTTSTAAPASVSAPTIAPTAQAPFASPEVPLRLAELSTQDRQQLPALKVSMHMWSPDIAGRFAIIDGSRVNEGDRIGDATVEAIQPDGVMLAWRGRRIRLSIR